MFYLLISPLQYFPDRFVRREVEGMIVGCPHQLKGCHWEDRLAKLAAHLKACNFLSEECNLCGVILSPDQIGSHGRVCPKALMKCPLVEFGCRHTRTVSNSKKNQCTNYLLYLDFQMTRKELKQHVSDHGLEHLQSVAGALKLVRSNHHNLDEAIGQNVFLSQCGDLVEKDGAGEKGLAVIHAVVSGNNQSEDTGHYSGQTRGRVEDQEFLNTTALAKIAKELNTKISTHFSRKDEEITTLTNTVVKMERAMRSKHAEFEDRDFRLSLIENSNHDGNMIWKIPQFSQRMADAQSGKYTSIFSLPFFSGRYGYKICLKLYILGDGIGKNTHMSLFFVIMKGDFDNILKWPFTSKVTFKLINQTGNRDIIDTFQPDPMSSSFQKPKSDMNIASGCPRFASNTELKNGGFIADDTVFIKCSIDCSSIKHP